MKKIIIPILFSLLLIPVSAFGQTNETFQSNNTVVSSSATSVSVTSFDPIIETIVNANPDVPYQKPFNLYSESIDSYTINNMDGTVTMKTHSPYFEDENGNFMPYRINEDDSKIQVEVNGGKYVFHKESGSITIHDETGIVIDSDSYVVRTALINSDVWNNLDVNNGLVTTELFRDGDKVIVSFIQEDETGLFKVEYVINGGTLKTTAYFTNYSLIDSKIAFTETINLPSSIISLNEMENIDLNNYVGQSFPREVLEENIDLVLQIKDMYYSSGLGFENLWSINISDSTKVSLDYANVDTSIALPINETIELDPTMSFGQSSNLASVVDIWGSNVSHAPCPPAQMGSAGHTGAGVWNSPPNNNGGGIYAYFGSCSGANPYTIHSLVYDLSAIPSNAQITSVEWGTTPSKYNSYTGTVNIYHGTTNPKNHTNVQTYFSDFLNGTVYKTSSGFGGTATFTDTFNASAISDVQTAVNNGADWWFTPFTVTNANSGHFGTNNSTLDITYGIPASTPTGVSATQDTSSNYNTVDVAWSGDGTATSYDVYRGGSNIGTVNGSTLVTWTDLTNVSVNSSNDLSQSAGGQWTAGARSTETISAGSDEFTVKNSNTGQAITGLGLGTFATGLGTYEYGALYTSNTGGWRVYEGSTQVATPSGSNAQLQTWSINSSGYVEFYLDGVLKWTSTNTAPVGNYYLHVSIGDTNAVITDSSYIPSTTFTDTSAPDSSNLSYTVDGTNSVGTSSQSTAGLVETFYTPNAPTNITDQGASVPLIIDWTASTVNDVTNSVTFPDSLGSSADGTTSGATTGVTGKIGNAWDFGGGSGQDTYTNNPVITGSGDFTLSTWVNGDTFGTGMVGQTLIQNYSSANTDGFQWYMRYGISTFYTASGWTPMGNVLSPNTWYHLALVRENNVVTFYEDGISTGTFANNHSITGSQNLYIGSQHNYSGYNLDGTMDETGIWNKALTSAEINSLYNSGNGQTPINANLTSGLLVYYDFEQTGSTLTNISSGSVTTPSPSVTGYSIERDDGSGFNVIVADTQSTNVQFSDSSASGSVVYRISGINPVGTGIASANHNAVAGIPWDPPTNLTSSINDPNGLPLQISLSWTSSIIGNGTGSLVGYEVWRDSSYLASIGLVNSYTDVVPNSSTYTYALISTSSHGNSSFSGSSVISTPTVPTAINDLSANVISDSAINLSWSIPNNGGSQLIDYDVMKNGVKVATITTNSYPDTGLTASTQYTYEVFSRNNVGFSLISNQITPTTHTPIGGSISVTPTTQGATTEFVFAPSGITGTPTPNFSTYTLLEDGNIVASNITSSPYYYPHSDNVSHTYQLTSTDNTHWNTPTIIGSITTQAVYSPSWSNNVSYDYDRTTNTLLVNRDGVTPWDLTCNYRTTTEVLNGTPGTSYAHTQVWYVIENHVLSSTDTVYIECVEGSTTILSITSFGPNRLGGGIAQLDDMFGDFTGTPVALIFVLLVAGLFTGRSAPTGILLVLALIGVLGFIGLMTIDDAVWGFILLAGVLGIFLGKRFL